MLKRLLISLLLLASGPQWADVTGVVSPPGNSGTVNLSQLQQTTAKTVIGNCSSTVQNPGTCYGPYHLSMVDIGCATNGSIDCSTLVQAALNSLSISGGGILYGRASDFYLISANITIPTNTAIDCGVPSVGISQNGVWGLNSSNIFSLGSGPGGTILLNPSYSITLAALAGIQNCYVINSLLPTPGSLTAALQDVANDFTGTAILPNGSNDKIENVAIIGFNQAIDAEDTSGRLTVRDVQYDGNAGLKIANSQDIDHVEHLFSNNWYLQGLCGHFTSCPLATTVRPGPFVNVENATNAPQFINDYCYGCMVGFEFGNTYLVKLTGGGVEFPANGNGYNTNASFTGSISGSVLTVTAVATGAINNFMAISGSGVSANTTVEYQLTSTASGGALGSTGTYAVSSSQTISSESLSGTITSYGIEESSGTTVSFSGGDISGQTYPAYITGGVYNTSNMTYGADGSTTNFIYAGAGTVGSDTASTYSGGVGGTCAVNIRANALNWSFNIPTFNGQTTVPPYCVDSTALPYFSSSSPAQINGAQSGGAYQNQFSSNLGTSYPQFAGMYSGSVSGTGTPVLFGIQNFSSNAAKAGYAFVNSSGTVMDSIVANVNNIGGLDMSFALASGGGGSTNISRFQLGGTSSTAFELLPVSGQNFTLGSASQVTTSGGRAVNSGATSDTIAAGISSTYESANTASSAFTITLAAPIQDGERRRVCFKNSTGTITWNVTSPATAAAGLPTSLGTGGCTELVYNSVSGTPASAPATTWLPY